MTARTPRLGIFWFGPAPGGGALLVEASAPPASEIQDIGGFKTFDPGHVDVWRAAVSWGGDGKKKPCDSCWPTTWRDSDASTLWSSASPTDRSTVAKPWNALW